MFMLQVLHIFELHLVKKQTSVRKTKQRSYAENLSFVGLVHLLEVDRFDELCCLY